MNYIRWVYHSAKSCWVRYISYMIADYGAIKIIPDYNNIYLNELYG